MGRYPAGNLQRNCCLDPDRRAILAIFLAIYRFVDWGNLFRATTSTARAEAGPAMLVFMGLLRSTMFRWMSSNAPQLGLQQGFLTNFWEMSLSILILIGILACRSFSPQPDGAGGGFCRRARAGSLDERCLLLRQESARFASEVESGISHRHREDCQPGWTLLSSPVGVAISYSADNFIIARILGIADVTVFSIRSECLPLSRPS